ncbi:ABC transporter permease [Robertmurraya massiliosenegalensis]|uniref:ABC transporter permease n=1 Tax=Robertmurraya massiliosenegalensis TaxID=1287657 RepID=UPI003D2CF37A
MANSNAETLAFNHEEEKNNLHQKDEKVIKDLVINMTRTEQRRNVTIINGGRIFLLLFILAIWEIGSGRFLDEFFVSSPSAIILGLYNEMIEGELLWHAQVTVFETISGYVLGTIVGLLLAFLLGLSDRFYKIFEPFVIAVNGIPRIALAPLFIIWFGIGITPKVVIAALMVFFIVFMNTMSGIRGVNKQLIDISNLMGARKIQLITKVILPSSIPHILSSLKIVVPMAMTGAIVGEFISSQRGLGYFISQSTAMMNITRAFAGIFLLMVVLVVMNAIVSWAESKVTRWKNY